jgi:uncharacterized protein YcfJ
VPARREPKDSGAIARIAPTIHSRANPRRRESTMKRLSATLLTLCLAVAAGNATAQTYGGYGNVNNNNAIYDYARVVRVDPVIDSRYGNNNGYGNNTYASNGGYTVVNGQRCYESSGPYNGGYASNGTYRTNDPYYPQQGGGYGTDTGRTMATVIGGIAGAVLGSKVGGGSGSTAAAAVGTMVGGLAGRQIYENTQRRRYARNSVQVCDPVDYGNNGYNNSGYATTGNYGSDNARVVGYDVTYEYAGRQFVTRTNYHPGDRIRVRVDVSPE